MSELSSFLREIGAWGDFVYRVDRTFIGRVYSGLELSALALSANEFGSVAWCLGTVMFGVAISLWVR